MELTSLLLLLLLRRCRWWKERRLKAPPPVELADGQSTPSLPSVSARCHPDAEEAALAYCPLRSHPCLSVSLVPRRETSSRARRRAIEEKKRPRKLTLCVHITVFVYLSLSPNTSPFAAHARRGSEREEKERSQVVPLRHTLRA